MKTADRFVEIARAEVGYKEKETNSKLDDPSANAGDENYTKYARDLHNAGFFNGNKNGYDWCTTFVCWCAWVFCGKDTKAAEKLLCHGGDLAASCTYAARYYKEQGRYSGVPRVGDQIFFSRNGSFYHTGIVAYADNDIVTTVEGNSGDKVSMRTYSRHDSKIDGYGHPRFDEIALGDVNGDGKVDAADATRVLLASVGKVKLSPQEETAADVNGDGKVNAADATAILREAAK